MLAIADKACHDFREFTRFGGTLWIVKMSQNASTGCRVPVRRGLTHVVSVRSFTSPTNPLNCHPGW